MTTLYIPDWLPTQRYDDFTFMGIERFNRYIIAFGLPESGAAFTSPTIQPSLQSLLQAPTAPEVVIAVGGWGGTAAQHDNMQGYWLQAAQNPEAFAARLLEGINTTEQLTRVKISGVDLDWEVPVQAVREAYSRLAATIKAAIAPRTLTMAVPAEYNLDGFDFNSLIQTVDMFHIMTYDNAGPWSERADHHAAGTWAVGRAQQWLKALGPEKTCIGFPAYGYVFPGTRQQGDRSISPAYPVMYPQLAAQPFADDPQQFASYAITPEGWTTFQSPHMVRSTREMLARIGIKNTFVWSADGLTTEFIEAATV